MDVLGNIYDNEEVTKYLAAHNIPEIIESLLTAAVHYKPAQPFLHIRDNLQKIKDQGLKPNDITWDVFIDENDLPVEKVFKPCFVEQHIFDNPFLQEKYHKNMIIAIEYHSRSLLSKYFDVLRLYQQHQLRKKRIYKDTMEKATYHYSMKYKRRIFSTWTSSTKLYLVNVSKAVQVLLRVLSYSYIARCFNRWRSFTQDIHWKNNWFQNQAIRQSIAAEQTLLETDNHSEEFMSKLPKNIAIKIFKYLNLRSRISCAKVCNSWHALLQDCALYTELNLSDSGFDMHDLLFINIIRRYKFFLYHIKLTDCTQLSPKCLLNLKECKNLQDIDLSRCQLNPNVLQEIGIGCPFVSYINLSGSTIEDSSLAILAKFFPSLKYLDVSYCSTLSEYGFYYLNTHKALINLAHLNISGCKNINGTCLSYIGQCCQHLTSLIMDYINSLTDECISKMTATCRHIRVLSLLQAYRLTDKSLKYIAMGLTELQKFYLEGNKFITDTGVTALMGLRSLRHIYIVDCLKVYDLGLKPCLNLRMMNVINFTDCVRITDSGIRNILDSPSSTKITELSLVNCIRIGDQTVQRIVNNCPNINCLSIAYCENVSDVGIAMLSHHPKLSMLDISGCSVNDYGAGCLRQNNRLSYLTMAECNLVTDVGIERLSKLDNLKYLDISYCTNISDHGMKMLIYEKKCLLTLNIAGCKLITNKTLSYIASVCDYLHTLNVSELKSITDKGIRFIRLGCKKLQYLNVSYCPKLNYGCITKLLNAGCRVVHTMNVS